MFFLPTKLERIVSAALLAFIGTSLVLRIVVNAM